MRRSSKCERRTPNAERRRSELTLPLVLLLCLFAGCTQTVEVTVNAPSSGWEVYGADTVRVTCHPARYVDYVELLIDSAVAGVDTYPDPSYAFVWDVTQLPEASVHTVRARAISGSKEYLSPELLATVGFRSRLLADVAGDSLWILRPDGARDTVFVPLAGASPTHPRFRPGCGSVVFVADHKLYERELPSASAALLDAIENGIYGCDASPVSAQVAYHGLPAATTHIFVKDGTGPRVQLTHDSDYVLIDSSRFTGTANTGPVFSPDGNRLAYYRESRCLVPGDPHEGETRQDAFVMSSSGGNPLNLTAAVDNGYFSGFTWTFDGKWVLFREGEDVTPQRVLAANMSGHAVVISGFEPVAMAGSPDDSILVYIGSESARPLHALRLAWTADTIYATGQPSVLSSGPFLKYVDWVEYSRE